MEKEIRTITAREVVEICKKDGLVLTLEEAQNVLDFMYKFSKLTLEILLKDKIAETKPVLVSKKKAKIIVKKVSTSPAEV